jgi:hypothetical protein
MVQQHKHSHETNDFQLQPTTKQQHLPQVIANAAQHHY